MQLVLLLGVCEHATERSCAGDVRVPQTSRFRSIIACPFPASWRADEAAAAFDGLGSPAQPATEQPALAYSHDSASYAPEAPGAAAWPAELPAANSSSGFDAAPAPWDAQPQQAEWAEQSAPWEEAAASQQPAPWEQPSEQLPGAAWQQHREQPGQQWERQQQGDQWPSQHHQQQQQEQQPAQWDTQEQQPQEPQEQQQAWQQDQQPAVPGYNQQGSWQHPAEQPKAWQAMQQPEQATAPAAPWDEPEQAQPWQLPQAQPWQPSTAATEAAVEGHAAAPALAPEAEATSQPGTSGQQEGHFQAAPQQAGSAAPEEVEAEPAAATSWQPAAAMQWGMAAAAPFQASDSTGWELPSPAAAPAELPAAEAAAGGADGRDAAPPPAPPQPSQPGQQALPAASAAPDAVAPQPWQPAAAQQQTGSPQRQPRPQAPLAAAEPAHQAQQAQREPDALDLDSPEVLAATQASSGSFTSGFPAAPQEDPHAFDFLEVRLGGWGTWQFCSSRRQMDACVARAEISRRSACCPHSL